MAPKLSLRDRLGPPALLLTSEYDTKTRTKKNGQTIRVRLRSQSTEPDRRSHPRHRRSRPRDNARRAEPLDG